MSNSMINYSDEMSLGMGFDSVTGEIRDQAIEFSGTQVAQGGGSGQNKIAYVKIVETQESLVEELEISSEVSAGYGIFSGNAKMDLAKSNSVHEYSIHLLAKSSIKNPPLTMVNPRLAANARHTYETDPDEFRRLYGDCYIERIISGGEYFGLFTFHTKDSSSQEKLHAGLKVSIGNFLTGGVDVEMKFASEIEQVRKDASTEILELVSGGSGIENKTNADELLETYAQFPATIAQNPVNHKVFIKEYLGLLPPGPSWIDQLVRRDTIETCGRNIMNGIQIRNKIEFILAKKDQFKLDYDYNELEKKLNVLMERLSEWQKLAKKCAKNIDQCDSGAIQPIPYITWPERLAVYDPLADKWEFIRNYWPPDYKYWFRDEFHPKNHPLNTTIDFTDFKHGEGRYWLFYKLYGQEYVPHSGIFSHPKLGTFAVWGRIFGEYFKRGHCEGPLGYPRSDEQYVANNNEGDRISLFENGLLWWDSQTNQVSDKSPDFDPAFINPDILPVINVIHNLHP